MIQSKISSDLEYRFSRFGGTAILSSIEVVSFNFVLLVEGLGSFETTR